MKRLQIRNLREIGPACKDAHTSMEKCRAIIELAEPVDMDGYIVTPEVVACSDDPYDIAFKLLLYGTVVIGSPASVQRGIYVTAAPGDR